MVTAYSQSNILGATALTFVLLDTTGATANLIISPDSRVYRFVGAAYRVFPNSSNLLKYYAGKKAPAKSPVLVKRYKCVCARTGVSLVCIGTLTELVRRPQPPLRCAHTATQPVVSNNTSNRAPDASNAPQLEQALQTTKNGRDCKKSKKADNADMQRAFENVLAQKNAGHDPHIKGDLVRWLLNISPATLSRYQKTGQVPKPRKIPGAKTNYWQLSEILNLKKG
jgi:predicted DNA-binding transcriptional regulator AlpA